MKSNVKDFIDFVFLNKTDTEPKSTARVKSKASDAEKNKEVEIRTREKRAKTYGPSTTKFLTALFNTHV